MTTATQPQRLQCDNVGYVAGTQYISAGVCLARTSGWYRDRGLDDYRTQRAPFSASVIACATSLACNTSRLCFEQDFVLGSVPPKNPGTLDTAGDPLGWPSFLGIGVPYEEVVC